MKWTVTILVMWAVLGSFAVYRASLPASYWFDVQQTSVRYDPAVTDGCYPMEVDRDINRPFFGEWVVTIMRKNDKSGFYTYITFQGSIDYRPENKLPDNLNLCWWTWSKELGVTLENHSISLPPGIYRIHTLWKLEVDGGEREIRRRTNPLIIPSETS